MRRTSFACGLLAPILALSQTPAFEVASIRSTRHSEKDANGYTHSFVKIPSPGRLQAENSTLDELIRTAYHLLDYQVAGPSWLNDSSLGFDVEAKAPADTPKDEVWLMLQTLLKERFRMVAHSEEKLLPVYELTVEKTGARLKAADPSGHRSMSSGGGEVKDTSVTMSDFALQLSRDLKRPVIDKTGITGAFDFELHYPLDGDEISRTTSLLTAIRSTLGLRLNSAKGPVEIFVVDHIEKVPVEN